MVVHRRKKVVKFRGSKTHGWGSMKKHRGKGNKGGSGRAGSSKKGDAKKPSFWKWRAFGKHGFKKKGLKEDIKAVNISYLEDNFDNLLSKNLIVKENDAFVVDISKLGYNKLLSFGIVTKKFKILAKYASNNAIEKIKKAGGEIVIKEIKKEGKPSNESEKGVEKPKVFQKEEGKDVNV